MRFYTKSSIDRGNRAFYIATWSFDTSISTIGQLSSAIKAHISSAIAAGEQRLQLPDSSINNKIEMYLRRGTSARDQSISDEIVFKSFQNAISKKSEWLVIFCLDMAPYMKKIDRGLSAVSKEITSLEQLKTMDVSELSNIGLKGGAIQMMNQIASSLRRSSSFTPTPSPSPIKIPNQMASSFVEPSAPSKEDLNKMFDSFLFACSLYFQTSGKPRLESEEEYLALRKGMIPVFNRFLEYHDSSRSKRPRDEPSLSDELFKS